MSETEHYEDQDLFDEEGDRTGPIMHEHDGSTEEHQEKETVPTKPEKKPMPIYAKVGIGFGVAVLVFSVVYLTSKSAHHNPPLMQQVVGRQGFDSPQPLPQQNRFAAQPVMQPINQLAGSVSSAPWAGGVPQPAPNPTIAATLPATTNVPLTPPTPDNTVEIKKLNDRIDGLESKIDKIEQALSSLSGQETKKSTKSPHNKKRGYAKHTKPQKEAVVSPAAEQDKKPATPPVTTNCQYMGGLQNRAWVSCNGQVVSVEAGDKLPDGARVDEVDTQNAVVNLTGGGKVR